MAAGPIPSYPPYYWPPAPGYYAGAAIATGIAFGAGVAWAGAVTGGFDWNNGDIDIDINRNVNKNNIKIDNNFKGGKWQHDPKHRGGVRYNNASVDKKFSKGNVGSADKRMDYRGKSGNQVIKVGDVNVGKGAGANVKGGDIKAGDSKARAPISRPATSRARGRHQGRRHQRQRAPTSRPAT